MNTKYIPCVNTVKIVNYIKYKFHFKVVDIRPNEQEADMDRIYLGEKCSSVWLVVSVYRPTVGPMDIPARRDGIANIYVKLDHIPGCNICATLYPEKARKELNIMTNDFNQTDLAMLENWYNDAKYWFNKIEKMYNEFTLG